jgi:hypothetical protein
MTATRFLEWWYTVLPVAFLLEYALAFLLLRFFLARRRAGSAADGN